jgi:hypothetical protein
MTLEIESMRDSILQTERKKAEAISLTLNLKFLNRLLHRALLRAIQSAFQYIHKYVRDRVLALDTLDKLTGSLVGRGTQAAFLSIREFSVDKKYRSASQL